MVYKITSHMTVSHLTAMSYPPDVNIVGWIVACLFKYTKRRAISQGGNCSDRNTNAGTYSRVPLTANAANLGHFFSIAEESLHQGWPGCVTSWLPARFHSLLARLSRHVRNAAYCKPLLSHEGQAPHIPYTDIRGELVERGGIWG